MLGHVPLVTIPTGPAPTTLLGSCGPNPGMTCRLVWDLSHNGRAAQWTVSFLNGPVHLLLRVAFVVILAFLIRAVVFRVINRVTERAVQRLLPQFPGGVPISRMLPRRLRGRRPGARRTVHQRAAGQPLSELEEAAVAEAEESRPAIGPGSSGNGRSAAGASAPEVAAAAAQAERALIDERRQQRVRALGSILRSAASVTIFSVAGFAVLGDLGINLAPLLASASVVGVAIGFGAQNLVRDYLAGIFMLLEDQYGVGDVITIGTATGTVETVSLRITSMRDVNGIVWHIRNGAIEQVGNESQGWARAVIDFPVPYTADLGTIRGMLAQVAQGMWNESAWRVVMLEQPEVWGAQQVTSAEVTMRIVVKTAPLRQWEVEREMRVRVKAALDSAGIGTASVAAAPAPAAVARPAAGHHRRHAAADLAAGGWAEGCWVTARVEPL